MYNSNTPLPMTSIIISMKRRDELKEGKHGNDTYDDVIGRLHQFYRDATGRSIVDIEFKEVAETFQKFIEEKLKPKE